MATQFETYRMRDGKTPLSESYFNPVWGSLDTRLGRLESALDNLSSAIDARFDARVDQLQEATATILALVEEVRQALAEEIGERIFRPDLEAYSGWHTGAVIGYDAAGQVISITEDIRGATKTTTLSYDGAGAVTHVQVDWDGQRRTETLVYDGGRLATIAVTEEPI